MKLTPVHVRGKRKALAASKSAQTLPQRSKRHRSLQEVKAARMENSRRTLETLPVEILELIFLYSANVSLPRSNPKIGEKLSSRLTRLRFFIWAFHDTWDQWFGISLRKPLYGPKTEEQTKEAENRTYFSRDAQYSSCDGDPELQSALLEQPWANMDFILRAQQKWADTYARDRWHESYTEGGGCFGGFDARKLFDHDYSLLLRDDTSLVPVTAYVRSVHPKIRIPLTLVTGPWDDEQQRRLFWLVRGGVEFDRARSLSWEYHREFLHNSVIRAATPSRAAYRCLMRMYPLNSIPDDVLSCELDDILRRLKQENVSETATRILIHTIAWIKLRLRLF